MRYTMFRGAYRGAVASLVLVGCVSCGSDAPSTPTMMAPTLPTVETRVGTVAGHDLAFVNFTMAQGGLVTLKVEPVLLITLRSGKAPEVMGDFLANSDNGGLTFAAPAGTNSVVIGNPFDADKSFTLSITHP
jgi:hypothetical protein